MRYATIKRRLRLAMLSEEVLKSIHKDMKGISDESLFELDARIAWVKTLRKHLLDEELPNEENH